MFYRKGAKFFEFIGAELLPYLEKNTYCSLQNLGGTIQQLDS
jgi:hypothetical protein